MPIKEEKRAALTRWTREKLLPYLVAFLLLVLCVVLGKALLDAQKRARDQEAVLEAQRATIAQLQKEPEEDGGMIHEGKPVITGDTIREQFGDLGELVAIEYIYTNADQYENQNQVTVFKWEVDVPFTAKSFLLSYDGRIKAGVALSNVQVDINDNARMITVTLPPAEITSHEIFEDSIRVFNEKDGIFNRITVENYADFISGQKTGMEQRAIGLGLLTSADKNAQMVLRSLLSSLPGMEDYRLTITTRR